MAIRHAVFVLYFSMRPGKNAILCTALLSALLCFVSPALAEVGIDERLGKTIPPDITFIDENGMEVTTGELINAPTVFSLVYLGCRKMCPLILRGKAELVSELNLLPGQDYNIVSVSFDDSDTPTDAIKARATYTEAAGLQNASNWKFLTGDKESIRRFTDAVGFRYERTGDGFSHVAALIAVSPKRKIARYIYGIKFLPFDLKMALAEAEKETTGLSARRALLYCFRYDPAGKKYVLDILKIFATVSVFSAIILFTYLLRSSRKRRKELGEDD